MKSYFNTNNTNNTTSKYLPLVSIGLMLNGVIIFVNRFIVGIPDALAIVFSLIAIIVIISGVILMGKEKRQKGDK